MSAFSPVIVTELKLSNIQRHVFPENRPESFDGLSVDSTFASYSSTVVHRLPALRGFAPTPVVENSEPKFRFGSKPVIEQAADSDVPSIMR